jgi:hypothetical protein
VASLCGDAGSAARPCAAPVVRQREPSVASRPQRGEPGAAVWSRISAVSYKSAALATWHRRIMNVQAVLVVVVLLCAILLAFSMPPHQHALRRGEEPEPAKEHAQGRQQRTALHLAEGVDGR